jgi:hypothetical protein
MNKWFIVVLLGSQCFGQAWSGILDPSRAVNWTNAGVPGGIPSASWSMCSTAACKVLCPNAPQASPSSCSVGAVTIANINTAIVSAAGSSTYVPIPATTLSFSTGGIDFSAVSNVAVRGAGANSTFLINTGGGASCSGSPSSLVCMQSSDTSYWGGPSNSTTWTASSYSSGQTSLIFADASNIQTNVTPIILDQLDDLDDTGNAYVGCEFGPTSGHDANCYSGAGPSGAQRGAGAYNTIRGQQQIVIATACSPACPHSGSTTVTISPGLYAPNWASAKSPGAWWASSPSSYVGVENLSLDDSGGTAAATVGVVNCYACWVSGVRSSTPGRSHIWIWTSNHITVQNSYIYGNQNYGSDAYGVETFGASDILVQNNIMQRTAVPVLYNSDCEGCVISYNYSINDKYTSSSNWQNQSLGFHSTNMFNLGEGNIGGNLYADNFHGNHNFNTIFRTRFDGYESNDGTLTASNTVPLRSNPFSRYMNFIGNVLGSTGRPQTQYQCAAASGCSSYASIYWLGLYPETGAPFDSLVSTTSFRWGNYDTVTGAVRWCGNSSDPGWSTTCGSTSEVPTGLGVYANAVPSTTTLPASFYLSSQPSWWPSGKPWPSIGPDVSGGNVGICTGGTYSTLQALSSASCPGGTYAVAVGGHAYSNPAMDCYVNIMGGPPDGMGNVLTFNASACYSSSGGLQPPQGLTAVVH